ncbi:unnamed protein product, partial [Allacma fusca]
KSTVTPTIEPSPDQGSNHNIINTNPEIKTAETKTTNNESQEVTADGVTKYF